MSDIAQDVFAARQDRNKLNQLIVRYLPFIKNQLVGLQGMRLEYDDMLSLAMLTFSGCVQQYAQEKGNFLAFCSACIRNRLIDENRKQLRYENRLVPLAAEDEEVHLCQAEVRAALAAYNTHQEQLSLAQEIALFASELSEAGIDFEELPRICPKQVRSRALCKALAQEIVANPLFYGEFCATGRIPRKTLSARFQISPKTVEKHRKYIVALVLLMAGEYPYIQAFLPDGQEVK